MEIKDGKFILTLKEAIDAEAGAEKIGPIGLARYIGQKITRVCYDKLPSDLTYTDLDNMTISIPFVGEMQEKIENAIAAGRPHMAEIDAVAPRAKAESLSE